jgi:hypothetical protein
MRILSVCALCALSAASLLVGILYWQWSNDLIPDTQPWGRVDDVVVMLLAIFASGRLALAADRDRRVREQLARLFAGPIRARLTAVAAAPAKVDGQSTAYPYGTVAAGHAGDAETADRPWGTLLGRIYLDICKTYQPGWTASQGRFSVRLVRTLAAGRWPVAYAFADRRADDALHTSIHAALSDFSPGSRPAIAKLYVAQPGQQPASAIRHHMRIGPARYFVFGTGMETRDRIHVGGSFESFLGTLGQHSRRNVRKARQHAAKAGIAHDMQATQPVPSSGLRALVARNHPITVDHATVDSIYRLLNDQKRGFHSVLRLPCGETLSCCSGFIEGCTAFILFQMNHGDYLRHNPSLTNRAFLIEALIARGVRDLVFINGCRGVLEHACQTEYGLRVWAIRLSPGTLVCAALLLLHAQRADIVPKLRNFFGALVQSG